MFFCWVLAVHVSLTCACMFSGSCAKTSGNDVGAPARMHDVKCAAGVSSVARGSFDVTPSKTACLTQVGFQKYTGGVWRTAFAGETTDGTTYQAKENLSENFANGQHTCTHVFGSPISCPDGGIHTTGVLVTTPYYGGVCASWDSPSAAMSLQECTQGTPYRCTKIAVRHMHFMKKSAGVLMMKRMRCDGTSCVVVKVHCCWS